MPVDSIPTSVTCWAANQSASVSSCPVIVVNVRVSDRRTPPGPGRRTVATTVSRCTSKPAHRSINTSIPHPFSSTAGAARRGEPGDQETEVRARSSRSGCLRLPASHFFTGSRHQEAPTSGPDDRAASHPVTGAGGSRHDRFFCEVTLHARGGVFLAEPFQLGPLGLGQVLVGNPPGFPGFLHPFA